MRSRTAIASCPDPVLVGRNAEKLRSLAQAYGVERIETDVDRALANRDDYGVLRCRDDADAARAARARDRRRQARLLREADRDDARRGARARARRRARRREARCRAGQAVPSGTDEAQDAARRRILRPHAVGARRVRLLGVRRRPAAGAAAVVELPRRGRRRHRPRHAVPLALRARQSLRRREERVLRRRDAHPDALGRERTRIPRDGGRRVLRDVPARWRRHRDDQQQLVHAGAPRRSRDVPRRRHAWVGRRGPHRLPDAVPREHAEAGMEPRRPADDRLLRRMAGRARQYRVRQRVQGRSGSSSFAMSSTTRRSNGRCAKARKACSSSSARSSRGASGAGSTCRSCRGERTATSGPRAAPSSATRAGAPRAFPDAAHARVHARRLCGRARRRRSAAHRRSVARFGDRLGRDDRLPSSSLVARAWRRRGDGHRAARHGARLADIARADPSHARRRARYARRARRERSRHRSPRAAAKRARSTTSSPRTSSRSARSSRSAAASS